MSDRFEFGRFRALRNSMDTVDHISEKARSILSFMTQVMKDGPHERLGVQIVVVQDGSNVVAEFQSPYGSAQIVLLWKVLRADESRSSDIVVGRLVAVCPENFSPARIVPIWQMYIPKDGDPWVPEESGDFFLHIEDSFGKNLSNEGFLVTMDLLIAVVEKKPIQL